MKIKTRTEVTIVTREITLLRIGNDEAITGVTDELVTQPHSGDNAQPDHAPNGIEYEHETLDT